LPLSCAYIQKGVSLIIHVLQLFPKSLSHELDMSDAFAQNGNGVYTLYL